MPIFREWIIHHPSDWTPVQAQAYVRDVTLGFVQAATPICAAIGPEKTCHIFLTVIAQIAKANPVWVENIKDAMARTYDLIESVEMQPPKKAH